MRHSTADQSNPILLRPAAACLRSSTTARKGPTRGVPPLSTAPIPAGTIRHAGGCMQPVLLRGRVDHIDGATGELLHRYTTVHEPGGVLPRRLQDPPRLPLPALRRDLPRRHLPTHPRRPDRRQGRPRHRRRPPVRVRHPHRTILRPRPRPPGEERPAPALPSPPTRAAPARTAAHVLHAPPRRDDAPARHAAVPGLLRLRRRGPVQRPRPRTVAPLHHRPAPALSPATPG